VAVDDILKKYVYFMVMCNFAIMFITLTGAFGDYSPIAFPELMDTASEHNDTVNSFADRVSNSSSGLDYMVFVAIMIVNGLQIFVKMLVMVTVGLPIMLVNMGLPSAYAILIASPVITFILYELGKMLTRVG